MYPVLFSYRGFDLTSWPVFALAGAWISFFLFRSYLRQAGLPRNQVNGFFLGCIAAFFVGAHGLQLLTVGEGGARFEHPAFSGFVLYGGVVAVLLYGLLAYFVLHWNRRLHLEELGDRGAVALLWALCFGRLGCTFYGCCYGTPVGPSSWPGILLNHEHWDFAARAFPAALRGVPLHPATLYEACLLAAIAATGMSMIRKNVSPGVVSWFSWLCYAVGRFLLEFIRMDERGPALLGLSPSQWISIGAVLIAAPMLYYRIRFPVVRVVRAAP